jgi:hypothetical protein
VAEVLFAQDRTVVGAVQGAFDLMQYHMQPGTMRHLDLGA